MAKLYRIPYALPSLAVLWLVTGCSGEPPALEEAAKPRSNVYLEAVQEAEAAKQTANKRSQEQQRIDKLIGRGQE